MFKNLKNLKAILWILNGTVPKNILERSGDVWKYKVTLVFISNVSETRKVRLAVSLIRLHRGVTSASIC